MAGTRAGAAKAKATILAREPDFYRRVGAIGGKVKTPKGFALNRELARTAGALGGRKSRRRKSSH